jgi:hypothetical protein
MEVYRLTFIVALASLLVGLLSFGLGYTAISVADVSIPYNKVTSNVRKASNSSASTTIYDYDVYFA